MILYVDRVLEHDTYERAAGALRRLDQAVSRVPKELELKAYTAYANTRRDCAAISPSTRVPVAGSSGIWPDRKTMLPRRTAWE